MKDYKTITEIITTSTSIQRNEIFDYEGVPLETEFENIFQFYSSVLDHNSHYGITPSYIFFNTKTDINACAGKENEIYLISINIGTIDFLKKKFGNNKDLIENIKDQDLKYFLSNFDLPISELMYQNCLHFTFYHEMGHLIQKSEILKKKIYEQLDDLEKFSLKKHVLEFDADQHAGLSIAAHTVEYALKIFKDGINNEKIENLLLLICSSTFFYLLSFNTAQKDIYYDKFSHPHPLIRVTFITFVIAGHCVSTLNQKGYTINIDLKSLVNKVLDFSEEINNETFKDSRVCKYRKIISSEALNILNYIKYLREMEKGDTSLATYKWNQYSKKIHNRST